MEKYKSTQKNIVYGLKFKIETVLSHSNIIFIQTWILKDFLQFITKIESYPWQKHDFEHGWFD